MATFQYATHKETGAECVFVKKLIVNISSFGIPGRPATLYVYSQKDGDRIQIRPLKADPITHLRGFKIHVKLEDETMDDAPSIKRMLAVYAQNALNDAAGCHDDEELDDLDEGHVDEFDVVVGIAKQGPCFANIVMDETVGRCVAYCFRNSDDRAHYIKANPDVKIASEKDISSSGWVNDTTENGIEYMFTTYYKHWM